MISLSMGSCTVSAASLAESHLTSRCKEVGRYSRGKGNRAGGAQKFTPIREAHSLPPQQAAFSLLRSVLAGLCLCNPEFS
jgi:hypothetical protein